MRTREHISLSGMVVWCCGLGGGTRLVEPKVIRSTVDRTRGGGYSLYSDDRDDRRIFEGL